jgi:hypothetical protein
MEGLSGYVADLIKELKRIDSLFRGGIIATPGIPIFLGGCGSPEVIRDLWDMIGWLKHIGKLDLKKGWTALMESFIGRGGGRGSRGTGNLGIGFRKHSGPTPPAPGSAPAARLSIMRCRRYQWNWRERLSQDS